MLSGDDATGLEAMKLGAEGVISVGQITLQQRYDTEMCRYALKRVILRKEEINSCLMPLHKDLFY